MSSLSRLRVLFIAIAPRVAGLINISDMQITEAIDFSLNEPPLNSFILFIHFSQSFSL